MKRWVSIALLLGVLGTRASAGDVAGALLRQASMRGWTTIESAHFRFHFPPDSAAPDHDAFAAREEPRAGG